MTKWSHRGAPVLERLADHSRQTATGCVVWTAGRDKNGYGRIQINGRTRRAHQVSWEAHHGPRPAGALIRHTCDNPPCINPDHLKVGDAALNAEDRVQRDRFDHSSARYNRVRLSMDAAREIRCRYAQGATRSELAGAYGVGCDQISRVIHNRNWKEPK